MSGIAWKIYIKNSSKHSFQISLALECQTQHFSAIKIIITSTIVSSQSKNKEIKT